MSDRLPSAVVVSALLRRVHGAGGSAMILAKGDADSGAILVLTLERGGSPGFIERGLDPRGESVVRSVGPAEFEDESAVSAYWQRRRGQDPDLWVVELDIPEAQRFTAETMLGR